LTGAIGRFAVSREPGLLLSMVPAGAAFGAIHALTPGPGKSVLASYLVGWRLAAARSLLVSTTLAATHVGSAVLIAYFALPLISLTLGSVGRAPAMETLSRGLLVLIGLRLVIGAVRGSSHRHEERDGFAVGFVAGLIPCPPRCSRWSWRRPAASRRPG
jgi:nickel/cobalt exporter